jgi:gp16 family phage-associated protein
MPTVPRNPRRLRRDEPPRTPADARAWFSAHGISISAWAIGAGVSPSLVYDILAGRHANKCFRGKSHRVAVLLGLKRGRITTAGRA